MQRILGIITLFILLSIACGQAQSSSNAIQTVIARTQIAQLDQANKPFPTLTPQRNLTGIVSQTPQLVPTIDSPTAGPVPIWTFHLSKVLFGGDADQYWEANRGFESLPYSKHDREGWYNVALEIAATRNDWMDLNSCVFDVSIMDTGGFERPADVSIGSNDCPFSSQYPYLLPPANAIRVVAYAELPDNQQPYTIIIRTADSDQPKAISVSDVSAFDFSQLNPLNFRRVTDEVLTFEIPQTARITIDFSKPKFIDVQSSYSDTITSKLYVPATVENIGGYDIEVVSDRFGWDSFFKVGGVDTQGNIGLQHTKVWPEEYEESNDPPSQTLSPGQVDNYNLRFVWWYPSVNEIESLLIFYVPTVSGQDGNLIEPFYLLYETPFPR